MRKFLIIILAICCSSFLSMAHKKTDAESVVKKYGDLLSSWAKCDTSYEQQIKQYEIKDRLDIELISKDPYFQISNLLVQELAKHNNIVPNNDFLFDDFMSWLEIEKRNSKAFNIEISEIKEIPKTKINNPDNNKQYVRCKIKVSSQPKNNESRHCIDITSFDRIEVSNHMIEYITTYEGEVNPSFWDKLWEDVRNSNGLGVVYEYGKDYPVNVSLAYSTSLFMFGLDFGKANEDNIITTQKVNFTDLLNYKITKGEYTPKYYLTLTPAIYMKFISIGWGVGALSLEGKTQIEGMATKVNGNDVSYSNLDKNKDPDKKTRFFMRPNVKLYIPCGEYFSIITSASYNWTCGSKDLSGLSYGLGLRYNFE